MPQGCGFLGYSSWDKYFPVSFWHLRIYFILLCFSVAEYGPVTIHTGAAIAYTEAVKAHIETATAHMEAAISCAEVKTAHVEATTTHIEVSESRNEVSDETPPSNTSQRATDSPPHKDQV